MSERSEGPELVPTESTPEVSATTEERTGMPPPPFTTPEILPRASSREEDEARRIESIRRELSAGSPPADRAPEESASKKGTPWAVKAAGVAGIAAAAYVAGGEMQKQENSSEEVPHDRPTVQETASSTNRYQTIAVPGGAHFGISKINIIRDPITSTISPGVSTPERVTTSVPSPEIVTETNKPPVPQAVERTSLGSNPETSAKSPPSPEPVNPPTTTSSSEDPSLLNNPLSKISSLERSHSSPDVAQGSVGEASPKKESPRESTFRKKAKALFSLFRQGPAQPDPSWDRGPAEYQETTTINAKGQVTKSKQRVR